MMSLLRVVQNIMPFSPYCYEGSDVSCNLCGSRGTVTICEYDRRLKRLTTVACEDCGLIRTDPMPTEAALMRYYSSEYRKDYQLTFGKTPPRAHLTRGRREAAARLALLGPLMKPNSRVLDLGSGAGAFLSAAASAGHKVLGLEPGRDFAAYARSAYGVEVIESDCASAKLPSGSFDLITSYHVLEHLREPVSALRQLADWLADDGIAYVAVPDVLSRGNPSFHDFHFAHVYNFTQETLIAAGRAAGLEVDPRIPPRGTNVVFRKRAGGGG